MPIAYSIFVVILSALCIFLFVYSKTGKAPSRSGIANRFENPSLYWWNVTYLSVIAAIASSLVIYEIASQLH